MSTILITGVGGPAGQNVANLLLARGFEVAGIDMRDVELSGIRFFRIPAAHDPSFMPELQRIARQVKPALLIPTVTEELPIVAGGWACFDDIPAIVSPLKAVERADDKYLTAQALFRQNVPVPRFALPSQIHSATELSERIGWPCISKPRRGRGGRGVLVRYENDWPVVAALDDTCILQEFAPGVDYAPNVFIGARESFAVVLEKTELKEGIVGNAVSVRRVDAPAVAQVAITAATVLGLTGPQDVDVRLRGDGQPVVLEINARFGANIRFAPEILDAALRSHGL
ncbi:MAG: ATP-grasp domain-containing protein [Anaerolineaceae bacterium]|nr:ATP-grasp domain-containing protein [Anaerolineaceae bacterium]